MKDYIETLIKSTLFEGIKAKDIEALLECTGARHKKFNKGAVIIEEGSVVTDFGIVLSGKAHSLKEDPNGKAFIVTAVEPGGFIGVLLAASRNRRSSVFVQAQEDMTALFFPIQRIISRCSKGCANHDKLLSNYLDSIAVMALVLHDRNDCLIKCSVREKILTYLIRESKNNGSHTFTIPFNREDMAKYLDVERSSLSRELSSMKRDGVIDFHKSSFRLL